MTILHIASIENNRFNGVAVIAPQHAVSQQKNDAVGFVNIKKSRPDGIENFFEYSKDFSLSALPKPFSHPDIVVFHEVYKPEFLRIAKELKSKNIPYVIIPHGCLTKEAQRKKRLKKLAGNLLLFNSFISGAAAVQCLSVSEMIRTFFAEDKKFVCTNGVTTPTVQKTSFSSSGAKLVYIGRLDMYIKGLDIMIEAASIAADFMRSENAKLHIYGPDLNGRYAALEKLIRHYNVDDIVYLGREVEGEEKAAILLDSDIYVQTSRTEAMPVGILEALSYGLPCLVSDGTSLGEAISSYDSGWVSETTPQSVAEALKAAVTERKLWPEKSKNAARLVKDNFCWDTVSKKAIAYYKEIVRKR